MKSPLGKIRPFLYSALLSLGYAACSPNVASADEEMRKPRQVASWERSREIKRPRDIRNTEALKEFFQEETAKSFYETFKESKTEYGGFMTRRFDGRAIHEKLYAFDDPSDEVLNNSIDNLVDGKIVNGDTLERFIMARDFSEMVQDPLAYASSKTVTIFLSRMGFGSKPLTFYDKWSKRIKERIAANMLPDTKNRDELKLKWQSRLASELKFSIVDTIYSGKTRDNENDAIAQGEEIIMEWHLHPFEIGPSKVDLLISQSMKERYHMVLSARNQRLHYWLYHNGEVIENGLLYNADTGKSKLEVLPSGELELPMIKLPFNNFNIFTLMQWLYRQNEEDRLPKKRSQSSEKKPAMRKPLFFGKRRIRAGNKWI